MNIGHIGNGQGEPWTVGESSIGNINSINGFGSLRGVSLRERRNGFGIAARLGRHHSQVGLCERRNDFVDFTGVGGNIFHRGVSAARVSRVRGRDA